MLLSIRKKIDTLRSKIPERFYYGLIILVMPVAYLCGYTILTDPATHYTAVLSNITVNFALFLFMYGVVMDKATKKMPKWKGWLLWGIGFIILILIFKYIGGMDTIW